MPAQDNETPTSSGIVLDESTGQRHVPSSTRADGSKRKEIRIRPGYQPPEDVKVYRNPSAAAWQTRGKGGVPGAEGLVTGGGNNNNNQSASAASNKNAKRREAKKKAKAEEQPEEDEKKTEDKAEVAEQALDPDAEKEKKARNLKKKLRQARDLREKKDKGESLLPEQLAKIIKINELIRELDSLGFDADGESKSTV